MPSRLLRSLVLALLLLPVAPAAAEEQLDWCAPVVVRPDQRWWSFSPCEPWWKPDTIASRARYVFGGFLTPASPVIPADIFSCWGQTTQPRSKAYHDDLRARAALLGRTLEIIYYTRSDIVLRGHAALPGFDPSFLVDAAQPLTETSRFFSRDRTTPCVCGCTWSDEPGAASAPPAQRLSGILDALGGAGTYASKVHYAIRPGASGTADGSPRRFFGSSAIADLRNPAYRAWYVANAEADRVAGGFDYVELNQKFHQLRPANPSYAWGGPRATNVSGYFVTDDTLWSSEPSGYGYADYVAGWTALAQDLATAGVPFVVTLSANVWRPGFTYWDDPASPGVDEHEVIRAGARLAQIVFLDRSGSTQADVDAATVDLVATSAAHVEVLDSNCGFAPVDQPVNPLPALAGQVLVTPDAGAVLQYAGSSITVRPFGTASGTWDAELWCHCPSGSCGAPDASVTGQTGASWSVPASTCDARWNAAVGTYRPRVRVTRAGYAAESLDTITICQPACSNGRDDDDDGLVDSADPACTAPDQPFETAQCENGRDDDSDGLVDLADPSCLGFAYLNNEALPPPGTGCGLLGIEVLAALVPAQLLRRRRR